MTETTASQQPVPVAPEVGPIAAWVVERRRRASYVMVAFFVAAATLIAMGEIDRLIAGVLTPEGRSSPLVSVIGPLALIGRDGWADWASSPAADSVGWWIIASVLFDAVFVASYVWLLSRVLRRIVVTAFRRAAGWVLFALILIEALEAVVLVAGAILLMLSLDPGDLGDLSRGILAADGVFAGVVAVLATLKCAAIVLFAILVLRDGAARGYLGRLVKRLAQAVWLHRLSAVLVLALFVFTCIPAADVLDQLPDLQRQWVPNDWGSDPNAAGEAVRHTLLALGAIAIAALAAVILGRARTRALATSVTAFDIPPLRKHARWWLAPVLVWAALWIVTGLTTGTWAPGASAIAFLVVPGLVILSYLLWWDAPWPIIQRPDRGARARWAWLTGDAIAVSIAGIAGLGLVRSFTAPVFTGALPDLASLTYFLSLGLLIMGLAMAVASPFLLRAPELRAPQPGAPEVSTSQRLVALLDPERRVDELSGAGALRRLHLILMVGFFVAGILVLAWVGFFPVDAASFVGAPGLTVLLLTSWGAVLGAFTVGVQEHPPAPIFRFMRLRADPVLTLAITVPLVWSVVAAGLGYDDARLHATRTGPDPVAETSTSAPDEVDESAFADRLDARLDDLATDGCEATAGGETFIPALIVVAEGGGIRAAYWTARAMEKLAEDTCLGESVLLSSGVSGGSVGLALTAVRGQAADTELRALADPDAVGTGAAALLVGDTVASATGLRFPSVLAEGIEWRDRAALIEEVWIDKVPALASPAELAASGRIGIPVLNSTDVRTKCKVLVSNDVATSVAADTGDGPDDTAGSVEAVPDCETASTAPAASLPVPAECFDGMEWATAAMLSARAPVITPAARVEDGVCGPEQMQLVDGGYAEGSGLGTAADLAPIIADRIAVHNAEADRGDPPMVPIVVYLKNSAGYDLREDLESVAAEPLVPIVGMAALSKAGTADVLLQRASSALGTVGDEGGAAEKAIEAVESEFPGLAVTVAPSTVPAVVPPFGWALSDLSVATLERAMERQVHPPEDWTVATLRDLLDTTDG
ncbi:patatin-like phospholipase family protein [Agromyces mariniharenae]|uniref:Uncharacterized protein n=1 Tax=Agromyces mariniharenae TaxID=2604423 RepID=A0A5S4V619_9MICO|nr:patatin-like phospholipase family protein [Agromyces mariniharenae]TYL53489.1 hypothetical protein FYC51_07400 [Agromyces mariniharenae]